MAIPDGYMQDARGALIPIDNVKAEHKLEDELVRKLVKEAVALSARLAGFRADAFETVDGFRDLVAQTYGVDRGGKKGNVTLTSYDGTLMVQIAVSEYLSFGPELQAAKALIDECVARWSEGADANLRTMVDHAFQVNKAGRIDTQRVLGLRQLDIEDPAWKRAMEAVSNAVRVVGSKSYARFYRVDPDTGNRQPIPLDLASV